MSNGNPPFLPKYSATCFACETKYEVEAASNFLAMAAMKAAGWQIVEAIQNRPVLCPKCLKNPPTT